MINAQKDRLMKKEQEVSSLLMKVSNQEAQITNLKRERDRLLEVSQNLRISMNKLEKQSAFAKMNINETPREEKKQVIETVRSSAAGQNKLLEFTESKIAAAN